MSSGTVKLQTPNASMRDGQFVILRKELLSLQVSCYVQLTDRGECLFEWNGFVLGVEVEYADLVRSEGFDRGRRRRCQLLRCMIART